MPGDQDPLHYLPECLKSPDDRLDSVAVRFDNGGNTYVTGYGTVSGQEYRTVKNDTSGVELWRRVVGANLTARALAIDSSGIVLVTGDSRKTTNFDYLANLLRKTKSPSHLKGSKACELDRGAHRGVDREPGFF